MATELMRKMLVRIAEDELSPCNGCIPEVCEDATTWTDMIIDGPEDKGVLTNCIKEELVYRSGKGRDSVVGLTGIGFAMYKEIKGIK